MGKAAGHIQPYQPPVTLKEPPGPPRALWKPRENQWTESKAFSPQLRKLQPREGQHHISS